MGTRQRELKTDSGGQYFRQLGRKAGLVGQPKFRLGSDVTKAQLAYARLGALWQTVVSLSTDVQKGRPFYLAQQTPSPAVWTDETLTIAEAVRKHQHSVSIAMPANVEGAAAYATYLDYLRQCFGHIINIVPADTEIAEAGKMQHQQFAEHRSRQARLNARIASIPVPAGVTGVTLYQAIDRYAARVLEANSKESGRVEAGHARRLKDSTPDMDLADFKSAAIERIKNYWASRPESKLRTGKRSGRPISVRAVANHVKTARRFLRWLDRSDEFDWEMPRHGLDYLKVNLQRIETDEETANKRYGVKVFSLEQLVTIYRFATDFERVLLLLGLNAAMAQAEVATLRWDEIEGDPLTIKRVRRKSRVYGEFELWPETKAALIWWRQLRPAVSPLVMITSTGAAYTRQRISNAWIKVCRRIERETDCRPTWWLSFKFLRKTAAQLVRNVSDGEVAGVFLSHGKPVASDDLADVYSNRPFDKVAAALDRVHAQLKPMFDIAPGAFKEVAIGRGPQRQTTDR
ncbi:MAG: hypothetical protein ACTHLZ_09365 [Tepidisphaeraceae bacterium]